MRSCPCQVTLGAGTCAMHETVERLSGSANHRAALKNITYLCKKGPVGAEPGQGRWVVVTTFPAPCLYSPEEACPERPMHREGYCVRVGDSLDRDVCARQWLLSRPSVKHGATACCSVPPHQTRPWVERASSEWGLSGMYIQLCALLLTVVACMQSLETCCLSWFESAARPDFGRLICTR